MHTYLGPFKEEAFLSSSFQVVRSLAHVVLAHVSFAFFLFHCNFTCAPHSMKSCAQGMTPTDNGYLAIVVEEINDNLAVLCIAFTLTTAVCFIAS